MIGVRVQSVIQGPRFPEWIGSMQAILVGLGLLHPYPAFSNEALASFRFLPEEVWGIGILFLGLFRLTGLVINGRRKRVTAWARIVGATLTCGLWVGLTLGLASSGVVATWWGSWPVFALVEFVNLYRASFDARVAHGGSSSRH